MSDATKDQHLKAMAHLASAHASSIAGYWTEDVYGQKRLWVRSELEQAAAAYGWRIVDAEPATTETEAAA